MKTEERTQILGVQIDNLTVSELLERIEGFIRDGKPHQIAYVNVDSLNQCQGDRAYRRILEEADLVYPDGMGVVFASRMFSEPLKERVNAGDFLPDLCRFAQDKGFTIYLLGGEDGIARDAAERLCRDYPGLKIVGCRHGFFSPDEVPQLIEEIRSKKPDILLVGMGVPRQEKWIRQHLQELGVPVVWGVGALFDYYAGRFSRAPVWMRQVGLEWLYRLCLEPGRLWKRYLIGNAIFTFRVTLLVLVDILSAILSWLVAYALSANPAFRSRLNSVFPSLIPEYLNELRYYLYALPIIIVLWIGISFSFGLYRRQRGVSHFQEMVGIVKTSFLFLISALAIAFLFKEWDLGRSVVFLSSAVGLVFLSSSRLLYHHLEAWGLRSGMGRVRTLVVGTDSLSLKVKQRMEEDASHEHEIIGFLAIEPEARSTWAGLPVLGQKEDLPRLLTEYQVDEVFFASEKLSHRDILNCISRCTTSGTTYNVVSDMFEVLTSRNVNVEEIDDIPVIELGSGRPGLLSLFAKRTLDIVLTSLMLPVAGLMIILVGAYLKLRWPHAPVLIRQERIGRDGKVFLMFKIRTMDPECDLYAEAPTRPDDPRISGKLGRFLRRTSLDEVPQLLNVIKGDMSLVGPRPEMPFIVDRYQEWQRRRLLVKPGITGLWQIMGRKDLPLYANLEYDFYYIQNQSLLFDLIILLKTIPVVLFGKGAY